MATVREHSLGSLFSIPDFRDYKATSSITDFPETFELTMPEVKNQGSVGSCVAHSLATTAEYFNIKETGTPIKLSTGYIYGWNEIGWLVQNSWGKTWAKKGRFTLPYNVSRKETWGVTDAKSDSSLVLEKPFKTKFGATCAKIIHTVISWGYNLAAWIKEKSKKNA